MVTKQIAWDDGSGDHLLLTYQGQGDGPVTVQSDVNNGAARSQVITIETAKGSPIITKNLTIKQGACPIPVGTVLNYAYTGSYQEVLLPAGQYKLQCWGAQGGSNSAASSYGITAKAGGKGGYSEGVLTLTSKTTVRIYVGGAGSSSAGGFNGGGSTTGSASYNSSDEQGVSRMGGGGGATDIRLSDGALLSRMIVAGGGSGGAYCYKKVKTTTPVSRSWSDSTVTASSLADNDGKWVESVNYGYVFIDISSYVGMTIKVKFYGYHCFLTRYPSVGDDYTYISQAGGGYVEPPQEKTYTITSQMKYLALENYTYWKNQGHVSSMSVTINGTVIDYNESSDYQTGYPGGGTTGAGYSSTYQGKQNAAGSGGSFGQGANQTATNYRYCSGAGGGGWYGGGGGQYSDSSMTTCRYSGGGSGWVNIAANASYRPSGYTGLQLDSGTTYAGNTSFPSTSGGTETGHSGSGYARITRLS